MEGREFMRLPYQHTCLGLALLASLLSPYSSRGDIAALLPEDTASIVAINAQQVIRAPLLMNELARLKASLKDTDAQKELGALGFDPFADVARVLVAAPGSEGGLDNLLLVIEGRLNLSKFTARAEQAAREHGDMLKIRREQAGTIYQVAVPPPLQTIFVVLLDEQTLAASPDKNRVLAVLERKAGKRVSSLQPELQSLLRAADWNQSVVVASLGDRAVKGPFSADNIKTVVGNINIADNLRAGFAIGATSPKAAEEVAAELTKNLAQARTALTALGLKGLAPVQEILGELKVSVDGTTVRALGQAPGTSLSR
jgi:hypothetical protein